MGVSWSIFKVDDFLEFLMWGVASTSSLIGLVESERNRLISRESDVSFTLSFWKRAAESDSANVVSTEIGFELCPRRRFGEERVNGFSS